MPHPPLAPWSLFQWGSRGLWYTTGVEGIYMAHALIPFGIRVVLQASGPDGQEYLHTFHMKGPNADPDYTDVLTAAQTVGSWWDSDYRHMVNAAVVGRQVVATGMNSVPASQATVLLTLAGTRLGEVAPSEVSCAVKFFTHLSGRRNHGGARGWPPCEPDFTGDHFTAAYITAMLGVFQNLVNQANAAGYPLAIASIADATMKIISGITILDDVVDSQRRRTINRGR